MNQRIRELAEQARLMAEGQPSGPSPWHDALQHFAELIVMDCASIVYNNVDDDQGETVSRLLLKTYGVE